jgi:hypothetical protein
MGRGTADKVESLVKVTSDFLEPQKRANLIRDAAL